MDLEHFVKNFAQDELLGRSIALYIIRPSNLAPAFENRNFFRAGVAGSREVQNIDRSVTASGAESRASSLYSRAAMYWNNFIQGGEIVAALVLPPSVRNTPSGPTLTRVLQARREGDNRPAYALKGSTMAVALEKIFHNELDDMPRIRRARTDRVEWFQTTQPSLENAKLALQSVGQGVYFDLTSLPRNAAPTALVGKGKKLSGGQTLQTTTHGLRKSPRLLELTEQEVFEEDGTVRLTLDDIEEVRQNTERGRAVLELITRRPKQTATSGTQTGPNVTTRSAARTQRTTPTQTPTPVTVRLTRSRVAQLRDAAQGDDDERRRRRIARALANI
tara:strand:+ start:4139 stop:5137 length:999 start_codon:yes stop_codon:yes gene_type:complete